VTFAYVFPADILQHENNQVPVTLNSSLPWLLRDSILLEELTSDSL